MDIDLARTFLEVVRTGSFMAAAERLHVTQTAVTARIRNLEGQLGCRLFVRNRAGARLTPDGERLVNHANQLVRTWEAARRELPLPQDALTVRTLGAEIRQCNLLPLNQVSPLRQSCQPAGTYLGSSAAGAATATGCPDVTDIGCRDQSVESAAA